MKGSTLVFKRLLLPAFAAVAVAVAVSPALAQATTPPHLAITSEPAKYSNDNTPTFTFIRDMHYGVVFQRCQVDTKAWTTCRSPLTPTRLADGTHTFSVSLKLANGRQYHASYTWTVDTTAPTAPTAPGNGAWTTAASASVTGHGSTDVHGSGLAGYQYQTQPNSSAWSAVHAGTTVTVTAQGITGVRFRAYDRAGNYSSWSTSGRVAIDRTGPSAPAAQESDTDAYQANGVPVYYPAYLAEGFTPVPATDAGSGVASYEYQYSTNAGTTWTAWTAGSSFLPVDAGDYLVRFQAIDNVGNVSLAGSSFEAVLKLPLTPTNVHAVGNDVYWDAMPDAYVYRILYTYQDNGATGINSVLGPAYTIWEDTGLMCQGHTGSVSIQVATTQYGGDSSPWSDPAVLPDVCGA